MDLTTTHPLTVFANGQVCRSGSAPLVCALGTFDVEQVVDIDGCWHLVIAHGKGFCEKVGKVVHTLAPDDTELLLGDPVVNTVKALIHRFRLVDLDGVVGDADVAVTENDCAGLLVPKARRTTRNKTPCCTMTTTAPCLNLDAAETTTSNVFLRV